MKDYEIDYKKLYEEEHKKYEGALERARGHHSVASHYSIAKEIEELEHIFPELKEKESEDEKVRKELIEFFNQFENGKLRGVDITPWIAWLEKQGHDDKKWIYEDVYLKEKEKLFQDGIDEVLENPQKYGLEKQNSSEYEKGPEIKDDVLSRFAFYQYDNDTIYLSSLFVRESDRGRGYGSKVLKAAEEVAKTFEISKICLKVERNTWMEKWYEKNGYEYLSSEGKYNWLENRVIDIKPNKIEQKPTDKVEPKFKVGDVIRLKGGAAEYTIRRVTNTTYYTDGWSYDIERCEEDYELVEQKATWSEEDEKHLLNCISYFRGITEFSPYYNDYLWLKSLKDRVQPQNTWKPTETQMKVLNDSSKYSETLTSLYNDLKKL